MLICNTEFEDIVTGFYFVAISVVCSANCVGDQLVITSGCSQCLPRYAPPTCCECSPGFALSSGNCICNMDLPESHTCK